MKIIFCVGCLDKPGGTEKVLSNKANYLSSKLGYEVHIITVDQQDKPLFYQYNNNIKFHNIFYKHKNSKLFKPIVIYRNIKYFRKKYKILFEQIGPDIITVNERGYLDYVIPFTKKEIPKIREFHSSKKAIKAHTSQMKSLMKRITHLLIYKTLYTLFNKYDKIVLLTQNDKKDSYYKNDVAVIPNMHKPDVDRISDLNNKNVISVGSMNGRIKRFEFQIDIWRDVVKKYPKWVLNIFGDGKRRPYLQNKINQFGLENNVILHGSKNDLYKYYLDSSIFLFTSIGEGFGMVLVEAMSYGIPCVSIDCPHGPSEIINNNIDGYLIEENNLGGLKEKLFLLMKDKNLRKKLGKNAFYNSKRFLPSEIIKQWDSLYQNLINNS